ncbi:hypothetical protein KY346_04795 [Candidatus Woesearchaeota archaeon]|nr:hypothetical protein [Candidatus Woesearchaeota archaeon]
MKKIFMLILAMILLTSCVMVEEAPQEEVIEETVSQTEPVMEVKPAKPKELEDTFEEIKPEQNYIKEYLALLPEGYWYYDTGNKIGAKVFGDDRASTWEEVSKKYDLAHWNPVTKEVYVLFGEISDYGLAKVREEDFGKTYSDEYHMAYVNITMETYPFSPVDWMELFKDETPSTVETAEQVISIEDRYYTSNLALHYDKGDESAILRFDSHYKVPVVVEWREKGHPAQIFKYHFDTVVYDDLNRRTKPVTSELVKMPEEFVVFDMDEARAYVKGEYYRDPKEVNPVIVIESVKNVFKPRTGLEATY